VKWESLEFGFWHPFGPYTGLTVDQILDWKRSEVERFGWTFWSFAYSPSAADWLDILANRRGPVYALCSFSTGARDPDVHRGTRLATHYRSIPETEWHPMPDPELMKVTNPFRRRGRALAFKVGRVLELPPQVPPFCIDWYSRTKKVWRSDRLPTRGEFLIRRGGPVPLRSVCAALELVEPYLAELKYEPRLMEEQHESTPP
jgi:hypothetical protein